MQELLIKKPFMTLLEIGHLTWAHVSDHFMSKLNIILQ